MGGDVPLRNAQRFTQSLQIERIVLDTRGSCAWRCGRSTATALVVQNHLPVLREGREGRPEQLVAVDHAAVHGDERDFARHGGRQAHMEVEPAGADGTALERGRPRARTAPLGEAVLGGEGLGHAGNISWRAGSCAAAASRFHPRQ